VEVPQKVKNVTTHDPVISLLWIIPEGNEISIGRDSCTHMFMVTLFTVARKWNLGVY
jgi:hypothetical protein